MLQFFFFFAGRNVKGYSHFENICQFLKILDMDLPYDSAILLLSIYILKKTENLCPPENWYTNIPNSIFQTDKNWKKLKYSSTDKWIPLALQAALEPIYLKIVLAQFRPVLVGYRKNWGLKRDALLAELYLVEFLG